jgi:uncharacterized protein
MPAATAVLFSGVSCMPATEEAERTRAARLIEIVCGTPWLLEVMEATRAVGPPEGYVAAGAIRDTVWNHLTGRSSAGPSGDVDVVYWSDAEEPEAAEEHRLRLRARAPDIAWEVTNQATVHLWHWRARGVSVVPHGTVSDGLATWPETATAVGVRLLEAGDMHVLAPFGLADLFTMSLRHNQTLVGPEVFWQRIRDKRWLERWAELQVVGERASGSNSTR